MSDAEFWAIIAAAKAHGEGHDDTFIGREEGLTLALKALAPDAIRAFEGVFARFVNAANRWDLWGAAYLMLAGCSDDNFRDFQSWLISMGQERFERTLADPESLAEVEFGPGKEEDALFEQFAYVAGNVFEEVTGNELPFDDEYGDEPVGRRWKAEELPELFPRLHASKNSQL